MVYRPQAITALGGALRALDQPFGRWEKRLGRNSDEVHDVGARSVRRRNSHRTRRGNRGCGRHAGQASTVITHVGTTLTRSRYDRLTAGGRVARNAVCFRRSAGRHAAARAGHRRVSR